MTFKEMLNVNIGDIVYDKGGNKFIVNGFFIGAYSNDRLSFANKSLDFITKQIKLQNRCCGIITNKTYYSFIRGATSFVLRHHGQILK